MCVRMYVCVYVCVCNVCVYVCMYVCVYVCVCNYGKRLPALDVGCSASSDIEGIVKRGLPDTRRMHVRLARSAFFFPYLFRLEIRLDLSLFFL